MTYECTEVRHFHYEVYLKKLLLVHFVPHRKHGQRCKSMTFNNVQVIALCSENVWNTTIAYALKTKSAFVSVTICYRYVIVTTVHKRV
jgi:hypothetical protein